MSSSCTRQEEDLSERAYEALCNGLITLDEFRALNELAGMLNLSRYLLERAQSGAFACGSASATNTERARE